MADLAILHGASAGLVFARADNPAERLGWMEPAPQPAPAGAVLYRAILRLGAEGVEAPFLYTVEQDAEPGREEELNAWYADEHIPRLAAVPGVLSARRFVALDAGTSPRYLAAYRLERREVFESPAWIEARETPWTRRARTFFRNPHRTMRRLVPAAS
ncbi:hypothetical protein QMO56_13550 [Roseomonas sp. E05]|uniref:DUF4286 family protein n=1 Tax=Roseomonas sp. E05 TaxID=3046310 RepID=UPI0024BBA8F1|nr:DUF4286 family protein [Roseomonas sp. E05]MDJ0389142.1 hypothetical protein [Roseomonas sp. E05]